MSIAKVFVSIVALRIRTCRLIWTQSSIPMNPLSMFLPGPFEPATLCAPANQTYHNESNRKPHEYLSNIIAGSLLLGVLTFFYERIFHTLVYGRTNAFKLSLEPSLSHLRKSINNESKKITKSGAGSTNL